MTARQRLLLIEDDRQIRRMLAELFVRDGFEVREVGEGEAALELLARESFDLVVLDVMLPGMDGFAVCREIRRASALPILMLTARDDEADKVIGLELGADDYVTKPFGGRELRARVRALLRRAGERGERVALPARQTGPVTATVPEPAAAEDGGEMRFGNLTIRPSEHMVWRGGEPVHLTPTEFRLLLHLARNPRRVFRRQDLLAAVWGDDFDGYDRAVDACVTRLRQKLEDDASRPSWIRTVWGVGYQFRAQVEAEP